MFCSCRPFASTLRDFGTVGGPGGRFVDFSYLFFFGGEIDVTFVGQTLISSFGQRTSQCSEFLLWCFL